MFTEKIELKDLDKMDAEYKDLLGRVLTIQADCEIGGPHLYVETMLPAAPSGTGAGVAQYLGGRPRRSNRRRGAPARVRSHGRHAPGWSGSVAA